MAGTVVTDNSSSTTEDPLVAFNFKLEAQGEIDGFFMKVSGIGSETEVTEHTVVTETGQQVVMKVPGRLKWGDIELEKGITSDMKMWNWRAMVEQGKVEEARRNGSIVMFNQSGVEVARWNFEKGWPSKLDGPAPDAGDSAIGVEKLTLVHEYIIRVT
jgi:phage tail-like protein